MHSGHTLRFRSSRLRYTKASQLGHLSHCNSPAVAGVWAAAVIARLSRELNAVTQEPVFQKWVQSQNGEALSSTPEELAAFIKKDLAKWGGVVKATGIVAE